MNSLENIETQKIITKNITLMLANKNINRLYIK